MIDLVKNLAVLGAVLLLQMASVSSAALQPETLEIAK